VTRRAVLPDMTVVDALARGVTPSRPPTRAERLIVIRHLAGRLADAEIAKRVGLSHRQVSRIRSQHEIAGLPRGTNRHTRKKLP
jgi:hypothetical protein